MKLWQELNERQQYYLVAIYEVDQEQEREERRAWFSGRHTRPASEWRWIEYGTFYGEDSPLKRKIASFQLLDEGTGSTFDALERRGLIDRWYTQERRNGEAAHVSFLAIQITSQGRKLLRRALGLKRSKPLPAGILSEWQWSALSLLWENRPDGLLGDGHGWYGMVGPRTWQRLKTYKAAPLVETYKAWKQVVYHSSEQEWSESRPFYRMRLTAFGEHYYYEHWHEYHALYPDVAVLPPRMHSTEVVPLQLEEDIFPRDTHLPSAPLPKVSKTCGFDSEVT